MCDCDWVGEDVGESDCDCDGGSDGDSGVLRRTELFSGETSFSRDVPPDADHVEEKSALDVVGGKDVNLLS